MKIDLHTLADGELETKIQEAIQEVLQNMKDLNTPWKGSREVVVRFKFHQNEYRDDCICEIFVTKKLVGPKSIKTSFMMERNCKTGEIEAAERAREIKGQMSIDDMAGPEQILGEDIIDTDTGEVIGKVTDFKARAQGQRL